MGTREANALWTPSTGRFAVSGSRKWSDWRVLRYAVGMVTQRMRTANLKPELAEGCCPTGADNLAERLWRYWRFEPVHFPANWDLCTPACPERPHRKAKRVPAGGEQFTDYCPLAGHHRNQEIVDWGPDVLLAFPEEGGTGTQDCMRRARAAGVAVLLPEHWR